MLHLEADTYPLGFPGTEAETVYLQDRIQHGWDLVSILAAGITYRYYWTKSDASLEPVMKNAMSRIMGG